MWNCKNNCRNWKTGKMKIGKKSQNEIVGFVVIVLVVTIAGLVFLSLSFGRSETSQKNSIEISNFLSAFSYHTTDCYIDFSPRYLDLQSLIKACYKNERCIDGRMACEAVKTIIPELIKNSFNIRENSPNKAYKLNIYYRVLDESSKTPDEEIFKIEQGLFANCTSKISAAQPISSASFAQGIINIELEICKAWFTNSKKN